MERHVGRFNAPVGRKEPPFFCDVTLREGEQTPGVSFTPEEKAELLSFLKAIGVKQAQIGFPGQDPRALAVCRELCATRDRPEAEIMNNGMQGDDTFRSVEKAYSCGPEILHAYFFSSPYQYREKTEEYKEAMLLRIEKVTAFIKATGRICNISFLDAPRTDDPGYLLRQIAAAGSSGADRIRIPDTVGVCDPEGYGTLVSLVKAEADKYGMAVGIHAHNDFGLALANTVAGIRAGADFADVSLNGLGDRAGNTSLMETAIVLEGLYGIGTGVDIRRAKEAAALGARISGIPVPPSMPFVGSSVFSDASELHNLQLRNDPFAFQGIAPENFGIKRQRVFGKRTTERLLDLTVRESGRAVDPASYPEILARLCAYAETHKGTVITEELLWKIAEGAE